jgi:hypothetical protein
VSEASEASEGGMSRVKDVCSVCVCVSLLR